MKQVRRVSLLIPVIILILAYFLVLSFNLLPFGLTYESFTAIIIFFVTIYLWATEILPLPVTAFLAMFLLALSGSVSLPDSIYGLGSTVVFLIIIGFFLAAGLTKSGLDKRIAYKILRNSHSENSVLIGLIVMTAFLSMIISNTTTTLLMVPIALHIMHKVRMNNEALLLGIAFAANIGGAGLLIGTPPNIIGSEALGWGFYEWMVNALPFTLVMIFLLYVSFLIYFRPKHEKIEKHLVKDLGPLKPEEKRAAFVIIFTLLLWIASPIHNLPAIVVGLIGGMLMFVLVYDWRYFERVTHWGTIILIAGAVSLGRALEVTGAAQWIATNFLGLTGLTSPVFIAFSFVVLALCITQFIQNTATAAMFTPVLVGLSSGLGILPQ
ncbi:MAG: DASS family sodium-coupled anion symporter, partial [Candidatus Aenigmarchaeota archaeon]|nr:DASS family sodium-coupled anion symporter [Candidatus Aenigmarchaeota archaeon]NIP40350.1 DASS family sodium-coupled anion symporter [Candidatus Aenigmarchaeota archaeon]NIQ17844.1 DASS family sodium-coupled anion symporter [Candidatus Aenigmarchaeota archaeon]NIS73225.1 DASS family sodium-coupled anion symporter [Candidatus Aenigmarchaeota archaeon]